MRGHIVKRGKNSYSIAVSLGKDNTTGKYKQQWISVKGTKKDAEKRLSEILNQLDNGTFIKPGKTTLGEYLEMWLKDYVWPNLAPTTAQTYQFFVDRHIRPSIGSTLLSQLKPEHLQHLYANKASDGLGQRSIRYIHTTLHKALKSSVRLGIISRNPADAVDTPKVRSNEMHIMNESDIHTLLQSARNTPYYTLFYLALFTGMRRSELLALRWSDIDLLLCQAYINRSLHILRGGNIVFREPKTSKARRKIAISPSTVSVLKEHKKNQEIMRSKLGISLNDDDLVFSKPEGTPLLPDTVTHIWRKLVKRLGLKRVRLHDARHTHASLMLKQGVHPKIVQERLGHASIRITLDTYSHVAPGLQEAAAKNFDELICDSRENETIESHY